MVNQDFKDLIAEFNAHEVEYLLVGVTALAAHGIVRAVRRTRGLLSAGYY